MFHSIKQLISDIKLLGREKKDVYTAAKNKKKFIAKIYMKIILQFVITITILIVSTIILFSKTQSATIKEIASGWFGAIIGYWFR